LVDAPAAAESAGTTMVYARVWSADQKADLDRQVSRVRQWAISSGVRVDRIVTGVGSARNGKPKKFLALLRDRSVRSIIVERRGRLAAFAVAYVEASLSVQGRRLVVVDVAEVDDDLVGEMTDIVMSLCARRYGNRAVAPKARRMIQAGDLR
jgi:predicted site-specific integrase-resolvase